MSSFEKLIDKGDDHRDETDDNKRPEHKNNNKKSNDCNFNIFKKLYKSENTKNKHKFSEENDNNFDTIQQHVRPHRHSNIILTILLLMVSELFLANEFYKLRISHDLLQAKVVQITNDKTEDINSRKIRSVSALNKIDCDCPRGPPGPPGPQGK